MKRFVFLHGVGSSGAAMRPLAKALGVTDGVYFPDGPQPFEMGPGRQWFSVRGITEDNRPARVAAALPAMTAMIAALGPTQDTVLIGFSQGAIMALHAVAAGLPVAAVIAIAGRLAGPVPQQQNWPPITLLYGDADPVMPPNVARAAEGWLRDGGAAPTFEMFGGLGHAIDQRTLAAIQAALGNVSIADRRIG